MYIKIDIKKKIKTWSEVAQKLDRNCPIFGSQMKKDLNFLDLKNWLLTLLPILTIELTFACVPAAERDQSDDADEQDTASTYCSTNNYQYRQGFCNMNSNRRKVWSRGWV